MARKPQTAGRGEGSIYKRGDRWTAELMIGHHPDGRRKTWRASGAKRSDVAALLAVARTEHGRGGLIPTSTETVLAYWTAWVAAKTTGVMPATAKNYALNGRRLMPLIGHHRLTALDETLIEAAYAALLTKGLKTGKDGEPRPLSRRSVEQAHSVLTNALDDAVKRRKLARNPAAYVSVPRPGKTIRPTLDQPEVERLLLASAGTRWHALWLLFVTTGVRQAEAGRLRRRDLDVTARRAVVGVAKSDAGRRSVPLSRRLLAALEAHWAILADEGHDSDLVFPSLTGNRVDPARVREQLARDLTRAGCPDVTVHDLRHTCATLLLERNVHPKIVQELLGHATIAITLDLYSHVMPSLSGVVADHFDELFPTPATVTPAEVLQRAPETVPAREVEPLPKR